MSHTNPDIGSTGWGVVLNDALDDIQTDADAAQTAADAAQTTADDHIADASAAHAASAIANTPAGAIAATTVQAAINELDTEKIATTAVGQLATSTTTNLTDIAHAINTANKVAGKTVYNTTTKKLVTADGATAGAVWVDATGSTAHTPA